MIDPISTQRLAEIQMKERLEQAEKNRYWKEASASNNGVFVAISGRIVRWAQMTKTASHQASTDAISSKRATAEMPSI